MTSITKLELSGVRSFKPDATASESIIFNKPLTLILGKNGAGKTTIIESLLNATTGKFPPGCGTDRASFVYDSKVYNASSVKAQIKLLFTGRDGRQYRVVRNYELQTVKSKSDKPKFSSLETVISSHSPNEDRWTHTSCDSAEGSNRICEFLGVSPAILEHVTFCHQEECNWPLGTPSEVKSRFDAIFAATRYVAALENLRENQRACNDQFKDSQRQLTVLRGHRERAAELRKSVEEKKEEIRVIEMRVRGVEPQVHALRAAAGKIDEVKDTIEALTFQFAQIAGRIEEKESSIKSKKLPQTKQTLEELKDISQRFHSHMLQLEKDVKEMESRLITTDQAREQQQQSVFDSKERVITLEREATRHRDVIRQLQEILSTVTSEFVIGENQLDERALVRAKEHIEQAVATANASLHEQQANHTSELAAVTDRLSHTQRSLDAESSERELTERQIRAVAQRLHDENEELRKLGVDDNSLVEAKLALAASEKRLAEAMQVRENRGDIQMEQQLRQQVNAMDEELNVFRRTIAERTRVSGQEAQIPYLRHRIEERSTHVKQKLEKVLIPGLANVGRPIAIAASKDATASLAVAVQAIEELREHKREANKQVEREQAQLECEVASLQTQIQRHATELTTLEQQVQKSHAAYVSAVGGSVTPDQFESMLKEAEDQQIKCCRHLSSVESMAKCYEGFLQSAKVEQLCVVCKRGLSESALQDFVKLNEDRQRSTPEQIDKSKRELKRVQEHLAKLKAGEHAYRELKRFEGSMPQLKSTLESLRRECSEKKTLLGDTMNKRQELQRQLRDVEALERECNSIMAAVGEAQRLEKELETLIASCKPSDGRGGRTLEDLQADYESRMQERDALAAKHLQLQQQIHVDDVLTVQNQVADDSRRLVEVNALCERRAGLLNSIVMLERERQEHRSRLETIASHRVELQATLDSCRATQERLTAAWKVKEIELRQAVSMAEQRLIRMQPLIPEAMRYLRGAPAKQLQEARDKLKLSEGDVQRLKEEAATLAKDIQNIKNTVGNQHRNFTDIRNHIQVLEEQKLLDEDRRLLQEKRDELERLKSSKLPDVERLLNSAEAASLPMPRIRELLQKRITESEKYQSEQGGMLVTLRKLLNDEENKLNSAPYNNIDRECAAAFVSVQTLELAVKDIEKIMKALDKAVQSYHQEKIQQVNAIISELWKQIYRGSDIDTIELMSEVDGVSATAAGSSKKNYNYRVVMRRESHVIDMRSKCSAGQKVLASVIIRVALSEAFSCDCGILALDEPTTNLDNDNATALAESLKKLIDLRQSRNFQLVVITHDEDFIRNLGKNVAEKYYFVYKAHNGAYSQIEERNFSRLFS